MKNLYVCFFALILVLMACKNTSRDVQVLPTPARVEVTRIVQISTTSVPSETFTITPTLKPADASSTRSAEIFGTPIVANMDCYWAATTQSDLNNCALTRKDEMEKQMAGLINAIKERQYYSEKKLQTFLKFQSEWEGFIKRECDFRSGYSQKDSGTMAPMNYNECLVQKYQDRLLELQGILHDMNV